MQNNDKKSMKDLLEDEKKKLLEDVDKSVKRKKSFMHTTDNEFTK